MTEPCGNSASSEAGIGFSPFERSLKVARTCRTSALRTGASTLGRLAAPALFLRRGLELATSRVDVAPARRAHRRGNAAFEDDVAEGPDPRRVGAFVGRAGPRVERDQIDLRRQPVLADQPNQLAGVVVAVVLVL